jgi:hypothetical protein
LVVPRSIPMTLLMSFASSLALDNSMGFTYFRST